MPPERRSESGDRARRAFARARIALSLGADQPSVRSSRSTLPEAGPQRDRASPSTRPPSTPPGAAHGTLYFKMLDDAAFYAANSLVSDRFLLTTAFNLHFTKPMQRGRGAGRGALDLGPPPGVRRRGADRRFERRGMRARHRHLPALAHRLVGPRRLSRADERARLPARLEASSCCAAPRPRAGSARSSPRRSRPRRSSCSFAERGAARRLPRTRHGRAAFTWQPVGPAPAERRNRAGEFSGEKAPAIRPRYMVN